MKGNYQKNNGNKKGATRSHTPQTSTIKVSNKERQETGLTGQTWSKTIECETVRKLPKENKTAPMLRDEHQMRNMKFVSWMRASERNRESEKKNTRKHKKEVWKRRRDCSLPRCIQASYNWVTLTSFSAAASNCNTPSLFLRLQPAAHTHTHFQPLDTVRNHNDFGINRTSFSLGSVWREQRDKSVTK